MVSFVGGSSWGGGGGGGVEGEYGGSEGEGARKRREERVNGERSNLLMGMDK